MTTEVHVTAPPSVGAPADAPLVEVADLRMHFPFTQGSALRRSRHSGVVRAVDGVSFSIRPGEALGLVGESGSGKSTTGRAILQLYQPTSGSVRFEGRELTELTGARLRRMRRRMQMIFQDPQSSLDPRMSVGQIIGQPLDIHGLARGRGRRDRIAELMETVGLDPSYVGRYPHQFSGGQRQRIGIARALAVDPTFIVCDEPVSALDVSIQAQIINLLRELQGRLGLTYLFIAHDMGVVRHISDRVAVMYVGKLVEIAPSEVLYVRPLHPYSRALLSAVPVPDPDLERQRRRIILTGDIPSPAAPPSGCRFHSRCWLRAQLKNPERCATEEPELREVIPGQRSACHFAEKLIEIEPAAVTPDEASLRAGTASA